jgi:hypothetical protein
MFRVLAVPSEIRCLLLPTMLLLLCDPPRCELSNTITFVSKLVQYADYFNAHPQLLGFSITPEYQQQYYHYLDAELQLPPDLPGVRYSLFRCWYCERSC